VWASDLAKGEIASWAVSSRDVVISFWAAMQANDWTRAASYLAPECVIDWPCSGERIVGRSDFASLQARYPTNTGRWSFEVHRLVAERDTVVSEVTVSDGEQSARLVAFSEINGEHVSHQVEYWPTPYDPKHGREDLTRPIERIP
jgi:predicted ester cyclase